MRSGMPVGKIARRLKIGPTIKTLKVLERRPNPPGVHGKRGSRPASVYGQQLIEKQKLQFQFMITENAMRRAYNEASRQKGSTGENLVRYLDERLDSVLFRSGLVRSMLASRQLITHRHVFVNGIRVNKPGYRTEIGDVISFTDKAKTMPVVKEGLEQGMSVSYIEVNREEATVKRTLSPMRADIPVLCNEQMVVEWYSR